MDFFTLYLLVFAVSIIGSASEFQQRDAKQVIGAVALFALVMSGIGFLLSSV